CARSPYSNHYAMDYW
nr:immunoglobulin heavy chain junction region [Mus musculus]